MLKPLSQTELALRDTLITKAEDFAFDDLTTMFGFERPSSIARDVWRQALRIVAYGYRGTLGCTWGMVELGTRVLPETRTVTGTLTPGSPHQFTGVTFPNAATGFSCDWVGRFVRLRYALDDTQGGFQYHSKILYVVGPGYIGSSGPYPTTLFFAPVETGLWTTEDLSNSLISGPVTATLELLPFMFREPSPGPVLETPSGGLPTNKKTNKAIPLDFVRSRGEECTVEVWTSSQVFFIPPTYLLDPGGVDRATFPNQPYSGHIMDLFAAINKESTPSAPAGTGAPILEVGDPLGDGPHPIYLIDTDGLAGFERFFDPILAAGVRFRGYTRNFCLYENTGTNVLFWDDFAPTSAGGMGFDNGIDGGGGAARWAYNYNAAWDAGEQHTVTIETEKASGRYAARLQGGDDSSGAPVQAGDERWLEINASFTVPVQVNYEWTHGEMELGVAGGLDLDAPELAQLEKLHIEFSTDGGTTWTIAQSHEYAATTAAIWQAGSVDLIDGFMGLTTGNNIRVRWMMDRYAEDGDNYAIAGVNVIDLT